MAGFTFSHHAWNYMMIAIGGALGAMARFGVIEIMRHKLGPGFPWGTFTVNLVGAFLIGVVFHLVPDQHVPLGVKYMLAIGFLGAFTTFSTFSMEALTFWEADEKIITVVYVLGSNIGGIIMAWSGFRLGHYLFHG